MIAITGTYQNGYVKLDKEFSSENPVKVVITFLEDIEISSATRMTLDDFSFSKSRKILQNYKGSLSDSLIEDRRE